MHNSCEHLLTPQSGPSCYENSLTYTQTGNQHGDLDVFNLCTSEIYKVSEGRVVPPSLSPSYVARKKTAREK